MAKSTTVAIIGGDKRMLELGKMLIKHENVNLKIYGFDKERVSFSNVCDSIEEALSESENVILPMPLTKDAVTVLAPLFSSAIKFDELLNNLENGSTLFCGGMTEKISKYSVSGNFHIYDYSKDENVLFSNAVLTSEAAIAVALSNSKCALCDCKILVCGYGRIGKTLSSRLAPMSTEICVSTRKTQEAAFLKSLGFKTIHTEKIDSVISEFDIIFNTVPHIIISENVLKKSKSDALFVDLASVPGGIDFEYANKNKIKTIHALGLPGLFFPISAAKIIKENVMKIINKAEGTAFLEV